MQRRDGNRRERVTLAVKVPGNWTTRWLYAGVALAAGIARTIFRADFLEIERLAQATSAWRRCRGFSRSAKAARPGNRRRYVLGISAYYHDSAAALLCDGQIVAAAQEERFTRRKNDWSFPAHALRYCLDSARIEVGDLDLVVFHENPWLKTMRVLETIAAFSPGSAELFHAARPLWFGLRMGRRRALADAIVSSTGMNFQAARVVFSEHHLSHAASAYFASPYDDCAVLVVDGVGEYATTSYGIGQGNRLELLEEIRFPHSLGLLYSAFTAYLGFKINSGEYKVMGLAPYGRPIYRDSICRNLIRLHADGSFNLNPSYFGGGQGLTSYNEKFARLFEAPPRAPEGPLLQHHMDVAASIQAVLDEAMLGLARRVKLKTGKSRLCLAGGVALNCTANGRISRSGMFEDIWIQPAAGDAGAALGAAFVGDILMLGKSRSVSENSDRMAGALLGPCYSSEEAQRCLREERAVFSRHSDDEICELVSEAIACGQSVGWFSGRMEFGPRALGARSILADARSSQTQRELNLKVKHRESFRPFAPAVLDEDAAQWFELNGRRSPYMLLTVPVLEHRRRAASPHDNARTGVDRVNICRSEIPAVTHLDFSSRVQTVSQATTPRLHQLLRRLKARTGVGIVVNTSFNVRGEPIVCTPHDAFRCFMATNLDVLVVEDLYLEKRRQIAKPIHNPGAFAAFD